MGVAKVGYWVACVLATSGCSGKVSPEGGASGASNTAAAGTSSAAGGSVAGATAATGGAPETHAGGAAGSPAGGAPVAIDVDVNLVAASPGCTKPLPAGQQRGMYSKYTAVVSGRTLDTEFSVMPHERSYFVWLPQDYEEQRAYRTTFLFMGCGDRYAAATATYQLMKEDPESIYVAMNMPPTGLPPAGKDCYDNTIGKQSVEWEFMGLVASSVQKNFCVDENRLFVAGYSSGAWVTNMFGCYFAGHDPGRQFGPDVSVRGQLSVTGGPVLPDVPCGGKVAALWIHDTDDQEQVIGGNAAISLPRVLEANGCTGGVAGNTTLWQSAVGGVDSCKRYVDCPAQYPVVFCTTSGRGHSAQNDVALPRFIQFQNLLNPTP